MSQPGVIGDVRQLTPKVYLGDAVYARVDEFGAVILTTENGIRATNIITLEPETMAALASFYKRAMAQPLPEPRCERCDHQRSVHSASGPCDASMCSCLEFQVAAARGE